MMKFLEKIKTTKDALKCLREGNEILEAQNVDVTDYDDQFLIESKDFAWSFPMAARAIKKRQTKLICLEPQRLEMYAGTGGDYANRDYCVKNNIPITPFPTPGGAILVNKGDILLIFFTKYSVGMFPFLDYLKPRIAHYLKNICPDAEVTMPNNDIEIDGKKISGSSKTMKFGTQIESIFFSGVNSTDHVKNLGHKDKNRELAGLTDFGINLEDFKKYVLELITSGMEANEVHREKSKRRGNKPRRIK